MSAAAIGKDAGGYLRILPGVAEALRQGRPVVALESTIIAHGLPRPRNVEAALEAERLVRAEGAVPATVGILDGRLCVGLEEGEIRRLGGVGATSAAAGSGGRHVLKASRRDLGAALGLGLDAATTVSATMIAARLAGITVFATGGIGGVHRGVEQTLDVSADLRELARTPVIVVSAGAKAILDLPRTLEYLETEGVAVVGFGTDEFPAFYSRSSGLMIGLRADTPGEIARVWKAQRALGIEQGLLVANPIPAEAEIPAVEIEGMITRALAEMPARGIRGKGVTPFLLGRLLELSAGRSLEANLALLANNVRLGARIAREL